MKHFAPVGLIVLILALIAAQCGPPSDSTDGTVKEPEAKTSPELTAELAVESEAETSGETPATEEATPQDEQVVEPTEAAVEAQAEVAAISEQAAACSDPLADAGQLRFWPQVWTAARLARFVGPDLVDPGSGLETNFCLHSVDYAEILSGGPPPDGIPPLDHPDFDPIAGGDAWLADVQPVIALSVGGEAKAYPLAILTRHEIANDEIDGTPVAVTFCPLCNAAIVFKREVDGRTLRFGVSGNLRNSDLIMWDAQTLSWWQQFTGEAIVGTLTGTQLEMIPAPVVAWKDFKAAFPAGQVLSNNGRNYGTNPYTGYDSTEQPFLYPGTPDPRLPAISRVLGYFNDQTAVAYPFPTLAAEVVVKDTITGLGDVVIFYQPGQVSALDRSIIENSKEVGSAHMYMPEVNGQKLTFTHQGETIIDRETGSQWDVFGRAVAGELEGAQLEPILSHPHFWFAWAAFRPDTTIYGQ